MSAWRALCAMPFSYLGIAGLVWALCASVTMTVTDRDGPAWSELLTWPAILALDAIDFVRQGGRR